MPSASSAKPPITRAQLGEASFTRRLAAVRVATPGRRRKWSDDDEARIVAETLEPGAVVTEVARRWQVCPQQVYGWRRERRLGTEGPAPTTPPEFVPIVAKPPAAEPA